MHPKGAPIKFGLPKGGGLTVAYKLAYNYVLSHFVQRCRNNKIQVLFTK